MYSKLYLMKVSTRVTMADSLIAPGEGYRSGNQGNETFNLPSKGWVWALEPGARL